MCFQVKTLVLFFVTISVPGVSSVYIENNGYKGITIAFSPSIQGNEVNSTKLKNVIQRASELLYVATRRRSFFKEIDFLYPSTWTGACEQNSVVEGQPQGISVYVADSKNEDGENLLRAQHSKACGDVGEVIYMSPAWLDDDEEKLSREFVQQWAIYRYGVFEETAEPEGWPCYTNDGKHWKQNGCYSTDISVDLLLDYNGLPSCPPVNISSYYNLSSSLMSSVASSNIAYFCDGSEKRPHDPVAPTRHNRICRGKPVWSVIKDSEDFRFGRNQPRNTSFHPPRVSFRCFQENTNYIIFSIQIASKKNAEKTVDDVRLSLLRFLLFEIWPDTQVSILTFHKTAETPFHLDLTQPEKVSEVVDSKVTARITVTDVCLSCGLQGAFNLSRTNKEKNSAVVFMVFASALRSHNLEEFTDLLESSPSRTYLLIIQDIQGDFTTPNLIRATTKTGGEVFVVPESPAILPTKMTLFLTSVLKNPFSIQDNVVVIHQSSFLNINEGNHSDAVEADVCLEGEMTYTLTCDMDRVVANNTSTGTNCSTLPNMKNMETKIRCGYTVTLTNETSLRNWTFFFHDKGGVSATTCLSIATVQLKANSSNLLTVRGWMNTDTIEPGHLRRSALIIYAEVMHNSLPVANAIIQAAVYSSTYSSPTTIELLDTGNGDPDIKKGDGIYSRYFTRIYGRGIHTVVIYAKGCLTSCDPTYPNQSTMDFSRIVPVGSFVVTEQPEYQDYYPPNRIGDLTVVRIDHNESVVTLQWTAPGDNYDDGTASRYNMKFSQTRSELEEFTFETGSSVGLENVTQEIHQVLPNGKLQNATVQLPPPKENKPYYLAIKIINKNSDASLVSNIVQIFFNKSAPVHTTTTTTTSTAVPDTLNDFTSESDSSEFTSSTAEGINQTTGNWRNDSSLEPTTNSTTVFTSTTVDNTTETSTTKDTLVDRINDSCDKEYIIILASSIGGGIIIFILIINAIVCKICFRKRNRPKRLTKKASLRPPHNMTIVPKEDSTAANNYAFSGPHVNLHENLQDFEVDTDYTFVPGSQRVKNRNQNYYAPTMQADNAGFSNMSLTRRFNVPQEYISSAHSTVTSAGVHFTRNHREDDTETSAVSLGLV